MSTHAESGESTKGFAVGGGAEATSRADRAAEKAARSNVDFRYKAVLQEFVDAVQVDDTHKYARLEADELNSTTPHVLYTGPEALLAFPLDALSYNGFAVVDVTQPIDKGGCGLRVDQLHAIRLATEASIQRGTQEAQKQGLNLDKNAPVGWEMLQSRYRILQDAQKDLDTKAAIEAANLDVKVLEAIKNLSQKPHTHTVNANSEHAICSTLASMPVAGDPSTNKKQGLHRDMGLEEAVKFKDDTDRTTYSCLLNITGESSTFARMIPGTHIIVEGAIASLCVIELTFGLAIIFNTGTIHSGFGHLATNYRVHMYLNITREEKKRYFPPIADDTGMKGASNTYWVSDQDTYNVVNGVNASKLRELGKKSIISVNESKKQKREERQVTGRKLAESRKKTKE